MSSNIRKVAANARDEHSVFVPDVKNGDVQAADFVLDQLGIHSEGNWMTAQTDNHPVWGHAAQEDKGVKLDKMDIGEDKMPNVTGMGARDAVFLLEKMGLSVHLSGKGDVKSQSIPVGTTLHKGMVCQLQLES